jgi:hypothetical protein
MLERKTDNALARLVRFSANGEEQAPGFTFAPDVVPVAFCLSSDGRVFVADDNAAQQIRIPAVEDRALSEVGRFGAPRERLH